MRTRSRRIALLLSVTLCAAHCLGYSVQTHEELIDLAWNDSIRPLLLAKFPGTTDAQLVEAHAYAYGGSAIQDMGYYPFGKRFFSNLTHYVRSGDFVAWMFHNARTVNEYAFAIGALSHYLGDTIGHSQAINPATAIEFPKLKRKFGNSVTYGESPHGHIRTEYAFDVEEMKNRDIAPPAYLERVGFKVPRRFLERAFAAIYGFDVREILGPDRPALKSYRTSVRSFIPAFTEAEVVLHGHEFAPHPDDDAYRIFAERVSRTNYERRWRHTYKGPGIKAHLLAIVVFLVPKIGGAADLAIKIPNRETQDAYLASVNHTVDVFRETLQKRAEDGDVSLVLANLDLDTGDRARLGDYGLADGAYAALLQRITRTPDRPLPEDLKKHLLDYYADPASDGKPLPKEVVGQLETLKQMKARGER